MAGSLGLLGALTPHSADLSQGFMRNAISARAATKSGAAAVPSDGGKTAGGAIAAAAGGVAAGAQVGSLFSTTGAGIGAGVGGIAGLAGYLFM